MSIAANIIRYCSLYEYYAVSPFSFKRCSGIQSQSRRERLFILTHSLRASLWCLEDEENKQTIWMIACCWRWNDTLSLIEQSCMLLGIFTMAMLYQLLLGNSFRHALRIVSNYSTVDISIQQQTTTYSYNKIIITPIPVKWEEWFSNNLIWYLPRGNTNLHSHTYQSIEINWPDICRMEL